VVLEPISCGRATRCSNGPSWCVHDQPHRRGTPQVPRSGDDTSECCGNDVRVFGNNSRMMERGIVIHRIRKEIGGGSSFATLSKTNYYDWAVLIRMMLQAHDPN